MKFDLKIPDEILSVLSAIWDSGKDAFFVGGCVRDAVMGIKPKDFDIEVYNTDYDSLGRLLVKYGSVSFVGQQFGIIKFVPHNRRNIYDFSIPRRENKIGKHHRDFSVSVDPDMTPEEAALRRDFTMNAVAYDAK